MMFRKISYALAAQFTAFVFALLLITGGIFLAADIMRRDRMTYTRLEKQLRPVMNRPGAFGTLPQLPRLQRDRFRIVDSDGTILLSGALYEGIPFTPTKGLVTVSAGDETYDILTASVVRGGTLRGYIQVADLSSPHDLLFRVLLFLVISGGISGLTFSMGLLFARRSLHPAAQMMERLEQFTQDASHELRTPLTAVHTSIDLALLTPDNREHLHTAKKELREISTLIDRLLELARLDQFILQMESVDLRALTENVLEKHRSLTQEKQVKIEATLAPVTVQGDPTLLRQLLGNLMGNAIKFNTAGGRISVRLTPDSLMIEDTGKGISPEALPHIFDRFYQEDAARARPSEGLGLGLALVKRIVDLHGWTIIVRSDPGKGTTFIVSLLRKRRTSIL